MGLPETTKRSSCALNFSGSSACMECLRCQHRTLPGSRAVLPQWLLDACLKVGMDDSVL